jgi:hypothetical protein
MGKGADFERSICKQLSEWWTDGKRDDIFWRSSQSGGRATIRGRAGKSTHGSYGDITALDPIGAPLLDLFTPELKRGYSDANFHKLFDMPKNSAIQVWEQWIAQAVKSWELAGSYSWAIIAKRDRGEPIIVMDHLLRDALAIKESAPFMEANVQIRYSKTQSKHHLFSVMQFNRWLEVVSPNHIRKIITTL